MRALPRVNNPAKWRAMRDHAKARHQDASYAQRQFELAVANRLRREVRQELQSKRKAS